MNIDNDIWNAHRDGGVNAGTMCITQAIRNLTAAVAHLADTHERVGKLQIYHDCAKDVNLSQFDEQLERAKAYYGKLWASTEKEPKL